MHWLCPGLSAGVRLLTEGALWFSEGQAPHSSTQDRREGTCEVLGAEPNHSSAISGCGLNRCAMRRELEGSESWWAVGHRERRLCMLPSHYVCVITGRGFQPAAQGRDSASVMVDLAGEPIFFFFSVYKTLVAYGSRGRVRP